MSFLLPFHISITDKLCDPSNNDLLLLSRGLGLQRIVCKLLQIYDSPRNLVLLVNASPGEENGIGEELSILGCRRPGLRVVGYEMGKRDRQDMYKKGGLFSVTSRILIVDMLQRDIPTELITGILVLHAEKVTALSPEAFIVRLFREKNTAGFVKAFSDQPEQIMSGLSPLRNIVKELKLRHVHIYPRFHEEVKESVEKKKFQTIQLYQNLTETMNEIHEAIIQCITSTLSELKRSNTSLDLDDFNVENAYFRSFDSIVRRQLDPVWHKVGPKTKQLVNDLATLRRLLTYLLTYDAVAFHAYLETIVASNLTTNSSRNKSQYQSPWLLTDAANVIFRQAKRRCYTVSSTKKILVNAADLADDADAWDALDEIEDIVGGRVGGNNPAEQKKSWPKGIEPVLEELPKWSRLSAVLTEIEEEIRRQELGGWDKTPGTNVVLIMTATSRTAATISEYLSTLDLDEPLGTQGTPMMEKKLRRYLWWKAKLDEYKGNTKKSGNTDFRLNKKAKKVDDDLSEAMKKKDKERIERAASRRRVRGAAPASVASSSRAGTEVPAVVEPIDVDMHEEAETIAEFLATQIANTAGESLPEEEVPIITDEDMMSLFTLGDDFDMNYGLVQQEQTVLVRAYSDDSDDSMLTELRPRFIIMFDPNLEFIRRVEVYRSSSPGLPVRMYFLMYQDCCEEHKFLLSLRREKDAFTRLIQEYAKMPIYLGDTRADTVSGDSMLKTISSRFAGGRKELNQDPSQVIVDMREFRSSLPSILHASKLLIIPATLTVGDYILTPDICVERKSIPDLVSSFNSGRLYTQCELMSVHYKHPILLIEFEEHKSFSLETTAAEARVYAKPSTKYPQSKTKGGNTEKDLSPTIQSKIVLLTLTFPRVRIIWSSSPYATSEIFNDLKMNNPEPDVAKAILVGAEEDPDLGTGVNAAAEELLRCLPGITVKNVKHVMSKVPTVRAFCELSLLEVQGILGVEPGKACWDFMHRGDRKVQV